MDQIIWFHVKWSESLHALFMQTDYISNAENYFRKYENFCQWICVFYTYKIENFNINKYTRRKLRMESFDGNPVNLNNLTNLDGIILFKHQNSIPFDFQQNQLFLFLLCHYLFPPFSPSLSLFFSLFHC